MKKVSFCSAIVFLLCNYYIGYSQILTESFDGLTFPPSGWANIQVSGFASPGTWQRVTTGTNPTCTPRSGAGMAYYNSYSWSGGNAADLSTPVLDFSSGAFAVSFWMYRDGGQAAKYDSVCVYVNTVGTSAGGTRIGVINRSRALAPVEAADGWFNYTFNVPSNYNTTTNRIIFKATSDFGNRMYIDDVSVYELVPPADLTSVTTTSANVCAGGSTTLYANGVDGIVYWYENSCGGTALGTGDSLVVTPAQSTTYFARNFKNNMFSTNCASVTITVNEIYNVVLNEAVCAHESITLPGGLVADTTGTYSVTVPTVAGCDSTVTLNLTVLPELSSSFSQTICHGDTLYYNSLTYSADGVYTDTLGSSNGCDSVVTINLTVLPLIETISNQAICFGDTLSFNGQEYSAAGTYTETLSATNGCDSLVTLNLTVNSIITGTVNLSICNGDSVLFNGLYYSAAGNYSDTLTSVSGCDSVVSLQLTIFNSTTPVINASGFTLSVQSYSSYQWVKDGTDIQDATSQTYTATADGMYSVRVTDANGCTIISLPVSVLGTSVSDSEVFSFSVFPNPVTDILHITGLSNNNNFTLRISNPVGEEIASEKQINGSISVLHLPAGFYILTLSSGNYTHHQVFVKQ